MPFELSHPALVQVTFEPADAIEEELAFQVVYLVLQRDGDLFGPTVNRAARLVGLAAPGSMLVDAAMTSDGIEELVKVRGFGDPVPVRLLAADGA